MMETEQLAILKEASEILGKEVFRADTFSEAITFVKAGLAVLSALRICHNKILADYEHRSGCEWPHRSLFMTDITICPDCGAES